MCRNGMKRASMQSAYAQIALNIFSHASPYKQFNSVFIYVSNTYIHTLYA
jgi:hypothetical protein